MVDRFLEEVYQWAAMPLSHARSGFGVALMISEDLFAEVESSDDFQEPSDRLRVLIADVFEPSSNVRAASCSFGLLAVEGMAFD